MDVLPGILEIHVRLTVRTEHTVLTVLQIVAGAVSTLFATNIMENVSVRSHL